VVCFLLYASTVVYGERFRHIRWCASTPFECLAVSGLSGRAALPLSSARALLVVGAPSSGTTQMARELAGLGLQIGHERSDSVGTACRDGTVSWVHGALRYASHASEAEREETVARLCSKPRPSCYNAAMVDGGRLGNGLACVVRGAVPWDECWQAECLRVTQRELGCAATGAALAQQRNCTSPFRTTLLQARKDVAT